MPTNDGQVLGQCLSRTLCAWWCPRQWGAQKYKRGEVNIKPCGGYKQSTFFGDYKQEHQPATKNVLCINKIITQQGDVRWFSSQENWSQQESWTLPLPQPGPSHHWLKAIKIRIGKIREAINTGCFQKRERSVGTRLASTILGKRLGISLNIIRDKKNYSMSLFSPNLRWTSTPAMAGRGTSSGSTTTLRWECTTSTTKSNLLLSRQPQQLISPTLLTLPPTRCLALAPTNDALIVVKCDASEPTQRWRFGNFNASAAVVR